MGSAGRLGEPVPPTGSPNLLHPRTHGGFLVSVTESASVSSLIFTGPLTWTGTAACRGQNDLFFAPAHVVPFGVPGRTLTVVRADVFAISKNEEKELIATMQGTMICLHKKE